jgi:SprT protein
LTDRRQHLTKLIASFVPLGTEPLLVQWILDYKIILTVTEKRTSILGDYRHPFGKQGHRITVNGDLNAYAFLITFVHEMAHLFVWLENKNSVKAHGNEWKNTYSKLMKEYFLNKNIFPEELEFKLLSYFKNPAATSCTDEKLNKALRKYDRNPALLLEELELNAVFKTDDGKTFRKGKRLRKRFVCEEIKTKRIYLFSPMAEIKPMT